MTATFWWVGLSAAVSAIYGVSYCWKSASALKLIVKTVPVAVLALAAWVLGGPHLLVLALALGAVGDACLVHRGNAGFVAGLLAFLAGHLAMLALIWPDAGIWPATLPQWLVIGAGVVLGGFLVTRAGALAVPVAVYVLVLGALGLAGAAPGQVWTVTAAALLFLLSDGLLGLDKFVLTDSGRGWAGAIWATYWGAQLLFFLSFVPLA